MCALRCSCVGVRSLRGFVHKEGKCAGHPRVLSLRFSSAFQTWKVLEVTGSVWVNHRQMDGFLNLWVVLSA